MIDLKGHDRNLYQKSEKRFHGQSQADFVQGRHRTHSFESYKRMVCSAPL
jgi:hypothetical protein